MGGAAARNRRAPRGRGIHARLEPMTSDEEQTTGPSDETKRKFREALERKNKASKQRAVHAVAHVDDSTDDRAVGDLEWLRRHAAPWIVRRVHGRTAGDGRAAKRPELVTVVVGVEPMPKAAAVRRARRAGPTPR